MRINKEINLAQLSVVNEVAAQHWQRDKQAVAEALNEIEVVKQTKGKVMGFLPPFSDHPSVFFKIYFYDRGYQFEVDGLNAAMSMTQVDGVNIPAVISILPEKRAILTAKRTWQDTSSELKRLFINHSNYDWRKIGSWLRHFHDSRVSSEKNAYFLRKKFEKADYLRHTISPLFTTEQLQKMDSIIQAARDYFESSPVEWVISHGDFGMDNIKLNAAGMDIIDFEDCQMAPREFDLLNFLTRIDYTARFPHIQKTFDRISHVFLSGYGSYETSRPVQDFFYLLIKLDMIESYNRRRFYVHTSSLHRMIYGYYQNQNRNQLNSWLCR